MAEGESTMIETVFENRFQHLEEMRRWAFTRILCGIQPESLRGKLPGQRLCRPIYEQGNLSLDGFGGRRRKKVSKLSHFRSWLHINSMRNWWRLGADERVEEEDDETNSLCWKTLGIVLLLTVINHHFCSWFGRLWRIGDGKSMVHSLRILGQRSLGS